jgi:hypothetical protein
MAMAVGIGIARCIGIARLRLPDVGEDLKAESVLSTRISSLATTINRDAPLARFSPARGEAVMFLIRPKCGCVRHPDNQFARD